MTFPDPHRYDWSRARWFFLASGLNAFEVPVHAYNFLATGHWWCFIAAVAQTAFAATSFASGVARAGAR